MNEYHTLLSSGGSVPIPSASSAVPAQSQLGSQLQDRYAALAELDNEFSTTVSTGSSVQGWEALTHGLYLNIDVKYLHNKAFN